MLRLERFVYFLRRKWWVALLCGVLVVGAQAAWIFGQPPEYVSSGRMLVGGRIRIPESSLYAEEWQHFFGTQSEIMLSERIRQRVLARLQTSRAAGSPSPVELQVSQMRRTTIFHLLATGSDPAFTENYLNILMDEYLNYKKEIRAVSSDDTLALLTTQFLQQEKELKAAQERMDEVERANNVALLQEQGSSAGNYLARLNIQLSELKLEDELLSLMLPEHVLERSLDTELTSSEKTATRSSSEGYLQVKQQLQLLRDQQTEFGQYRRAKHPKMIKLAEDIARSERIIAIYEKQTMEQIASAKQSVQLKFQAVSNSVRFWETNVLEASRRLSEWTRAKANVQRLQGLYERLQALLQNVDVNKHLDLETIVVLERASPAVARRQLPLKIGLAAVIGAIVGLALILFLEQRDDRLTSRKELEQHFGATIVAEVPELRRTRKTKLLAPVVTADARHLFAEAYRHVRSALHFAPGNRPRVLLVTSAIPNEGKSTVALNLARILAFGGARVLLVDSDLRTGSMHEIFKCKAEPGLSDAVRSSHGLLAPICTTELAGLSFLPRGGIDAQTGEVFLSSNMEKLIHSWSSQFDFVIMDSAPVCVADDTLSLAPKVDGVLFVVRNSFTPAHLLREALAMLSQRQAKLLGFIFNCGASKAKQSLIGKYRLLPATPAA